jgi:hypothetical protein
MQEHGVESAPETHSPHISLQVLALGIELAGDGQHVI